MKVILKDSEGNDVTVGYDMFLNEDGVNEPLFWIDTKSEAVTLVMSKNDMTKLVNAIDLLRDNI